jgi:SEC-C motif
VTEHSESFADPREAGRTIPRNAACPCNSGLRYKHCCALPDNSAEQVSVRHQRKRDFGLMLQRRGDLAQAIETYDAILQEHCEDWDVAHMRATVTTSSAQWTRPDLRLRHSW